MTDTSNADVLAGYISDRDLARERKISERTQRLERQRGDGPPFAKIGNQIFYPIDDFRAWLASRVIRPVRSDHGRAA